MKPLLWLDLSCQSKHCRRTKNPTRFKPLECQAAITYYLTHPQQVEDYLEERRQMAQQRRTQIAEDNNLIGLRQRLLDRGQSKISNI